MSDLLPLFPLPNVVLFPNVFLPLHIFEPRYRELVADALASDRMIGMVLLQPGWEHEYEGRPPVYPIGCSGVITHVERLADGRYNLVLRGVERFRIVHEEHDRSYRRALVEPVADLEPGESERTTLQRHRKRLESLLAPVVERSREADAPHAAGGEPRIPAAMSDADLVNALAQYLDLEPIEKQALLEHDSLCRRAAALVDLLEMRTLAPRASWTPNLAH